MANGTDSGSFYSKIKGFLPEVVGAGIGAALGGPAGAVSGAAGAGEQEIRQQDIQAQRQQKIAEMVQQEQRHKDELAQRQQFHDDHEEDLKLQRTMMQVNQDENRAQRGTIAAGNLAARIDAEKGREQIAQAMLALHEGNNISDADYKTIIGGADPSWARFSGVSSAAGRKVIVDQIAKQNATASDSMFMSSMQTIADKAYGGDLNKAIADWGNRPRAEVVRTAHGVLDKGLETPDKVKKEADQNAAQASNLAKDLKAADTVRKGTLTGKLGIGGAAARARDLIHGLTGKTWESYTDIEKKNDERTLRQFLKAHPDKANDYDAMAQILRPKTTAPTLPVSASAGGVKKVSAGGLPSGALRPSKLPDGNYESGGKKFTVKDGHLYPEGGPSAPAAGGGL